MNIKTVFSNWKYLTLAAITTISFWIIFAILDGLLFFYPSVVFWIPNDAIINFIFSTIISVFIGLVVSMNMYFIFSKYNNSVNRIGSSSNACSIKVRTNNGNSKIKNKNSLYSLYLSPLLTILSTGCISCSSSLGLITLSSLSGIAGVGTATAFASLITEYQFPIRLITLAILGWSFVSINRAIDNNNSSTVKNNNVMSQ